MFETQSEYSFLLQFKEENRPAHNSWLDKKISHHEKLFQCDIKDKVMT